MRKRRFNVITKNLFLLQRDLYVQKKLFLKSTFACLLVPTAIRSLFFPAFTLVDDDSHKVILSRQSGRF